MTERNEAIHRAARAALPATSGPRDEAAQSGADPSHGLSGSSLALTPQPSAPLASTQDSRSNGGGTGRVDVPRSRLAEALAGARERSHDGEAEP